LPDGMASTADRTQFDAPDSSPLNPISLGLKVFNLVDRLNVMDEPAGRSTVNLCIKGRKPA